jgi:glyceraldehyde-3-phosphate dehydrogenase/erythrose-4-phosphate dehydrogenase
MKTEKRTIQDSWKLYFQHLKRHRKLMSVIEEVAKKMFVSFDMQDYKNMVIFERELTRTTETMDINFRALVEIEKEVGFKNATVWAN